MVSLFFPYMVRHTQLVNKSKISECVRAQHWCHVSRQSKTKIYVSLCLCLLLLLCHHFLLLHLHWIARNSFANCRDYTVPQWLPLMFYIFSRMDICMRSVPNYSYVLDKMVFYLPILQNLVPLNPDEHTHPWSSDHNSQLGSLGDDICVYRIGTFCTVGRWHRHACFCVEKEGFRTHSNHTLCNFLPSATPKWGSRSITLWWTFICWGIICIRSGGV